MRDLLVALVLSLVMIPLVLFTEGAPRFALGLVFVLLLPGYALIAALFPGKGSLTSFERVALSFGFSMALVPLVGLALSYSPWGVRIVPLLLSLVLLVVAMLALAGYRRWTLPSDERFAPGFDIRPPLLGWWRTSRGLDRVLSVVLAVAIVSALGTFGYAVAKPKTGERFTEFFIVGTGGVAESYPTQVSVGETATVMVGIWNREQKPMDYRVVVTVSGEDVAEVEPITVDFYDQPVQRELSFAPPKAGRNQKVQFLLYKGDSATPSEELHLWMDVK